MQANVEGIRQILHLLPVREAVWLALAIRVDNERRCWPSLKCIAEDISGPNGINPSRARMVPTRISELERMGLIKVEQRGGGRHKPNHYFLPLFVFGKDNQSPNSEVPFSELSYTERQNTETKGRNSETFCRNSETFCRNSETPQDKELEPHNDNHKTITNTNTTTDSPLFVKLLETLRSLPKWTPNESDREWLTEFIQDLSITEDHIKGCRDRYSEKSGKLNKGIWKSRLRWWVKQDRQFWESRAAKHQTHMPSKEHTAEELAESWGQRA